MSVTVATGDATGRQITAAGHYML